MLLNKIESSHFVFIFQKLESGRPTEQNLSEEEKERRLNLLMLFYNSYATSKLIYRKEHSGKVENRLTLPEKKREYESLPDNMR